MKSGFFIRKSHRYIAIIVSIQLLAWSISGIYFTWNDIDKIHGDHLWEKSKLTEFNSSVNPSEILQKINDLKTLESISKITFLESPAYLINYKDENKILKSVVYDIKFRKIHGRVSKEQIKKSALLQSKLNAQIISTELIESTDSHHEYRGKSLPVWAVQFNDSENATFYLSPQTAEIKSVRHDSWRWFDFLWMLHTMDYEGRDNFGNISIRIFSIIAFVTALSGIVLFVLSSMKLRKSQRNT